MRSSLAPIWSVDRVLPEDERGQGVEGGLERGLERERGVNENIVVLLRMDPLYRVEILFNSRACKSKYLPNLG